MIDRDQLFKALGMCLDAGRLCAGPECPYYYKDRERCMDHLMADSLLLLRMLLPDPPKEEKHET